MSDLRYPKDKLGANIAPGRVVALAISSHRELKVAKVVRVDTVIKERWTNQGLTPYTSWEVTIQSRQHDWREDTHKWGPERVASWQDMIVLPQTPEEIEQVYSARHNA